jgi:REP element-mobilizing transposase RayT
LIIQQEIRFRTWGGRREGAGRKKCKDSGVSHLRREALKRRFPVHVTLRVLDHVYNLRSKRCFGPIARALSFARERFGMRISEYAVLGNHIHLLVEAENEQALATGMQGLEIRIARGLNRVMKRSGSVFADRYHSRILRTPAEVRNAVSYVLRNYRKHATEWGEHLPPTWRDPYCSSTRRELTAPPRSWLLQHSLF